MLLPVLRSLIPRTSKGSSRVHVVASTVVQVHSAPKSPLNYKKKYAVGLPSHFWHPVFIHYSTLIHGAQYKCLIASDFVPDFGLDTNILPSLVLWRCVECIIFHISSTLCAGWKKGASRGGSCTVARTRILTLLVAIIISLLTWWNSESSSDPPTPPPTLFWWDTTTMDGGRMAVYGMAATGINNVVALITTGEWVWVTLDSLKVFSTEIGVLHKWQGGWQVIFGNWR